MARYTVLLYPAESGGYVAMAPLCDLATEGDTVEHALAMAREVAELHMSGLIEDGEAVIDEDDPSIVASIDVAVPVPVGASSRVDQR